MDAPLSFCTKEEQRAVNRFLWSEGVSGAEIHWGLLSQYGDSALLFRSVNKWIDMFKCGRKSMMHEAGSPLTSTTDEKIKQVQHIVMANQRVTIDNVACSLQINHGSAFRIIHNELGFHKVCARWVKNAAY